ncbi:MAG: UDP-N-acetylmuramoyl-tripeptide--D-alanyl-D-alanine ligase [Pseudomonadota bacterium]
MTALWTSDDATRATGGTATTGFACTGLSIDTRSLAPGDLFIALKDQRDGHDFVANAFAAGAAAALVTRRPDGVDETQPLLIVEDVQEALEDLAHAARSRTVAKVVGITGSVGKTSTKDMLRHVLAKQGKVHAAEKSFNNHWGVPLTLARCPVDADFAVIEIGMNAPGEIAPLAKLASLDVAIVTTVAAAHLAAFESLEGIAHEKGSIFEGLNEGGTAIFNGDLDTTAILQDAAAGAKSSLCFGTTEGTDIAVRDIELSADQTSLIVDLLGDRYQVTLPLAGRHFAMNAAAVLAAVEAVGANPAQAARDLSTWRPPAGRGTRESLNLAHGRLTLLDDAYNANPTSMAAAFEVLAATPPSNQGRRIAVLGDMLELGTTEVSLHANLAHHPSLAETCVLCVGPRMAHLHAALPEGQRLGHVSDADAATEALLPHLRDGDVVLVKGSNGSRVSQVVRALKAKAAALEQGP